MLRSCFYSVCWVPVSDEMGDFVKQLRDLIEFTYRANGGKRVVLVAHSMGNLHALYLLNQQSQAWKDKYIRLFIAVSAPWAGTVKTLRLMASGKITEP